MTQQEVQTLQLKLLNECNYYKQLCTFNISDSYIPRASANSKGQIIYSQSMLDLLTLNEGLSIGYHEVVHIIFRHGLKRQGYWFTTHDEQGLYTLCRNQELQADLFSYLTSLKNYEEPKLISALKKLVPEYDYSKESDSHPSFNQREQLYKKFERRYYEHF